MGCVNSKKAAANDVVREIEPGKARPVIEETREDRAALRAKLLRRGTTEPGGNVNGSTNGDADKKSASTPTKAAAAAIAAPPTAAAAAAAAAAQKILVVSSNGIHCNKKSKSLVTALYHLGAAATQASGNAGELDANGESGTVTGGGSGGGSNDLDDLFRQDAATAAAKKSKAVYKAVLKMALSSDADMHITHEEFGAFAAATHDVNVLLRVVAGLQYMLVRVALDAPASE
jgi:hypothetical protein